MTNEEAKKLVPGDELILANPLRRMMAVVGDKAVVGPKAYHYCENHDTYYLDIIWKKDYGQSDGNYFPEIFDLAVKPSSACVHSPMLLLTNYCCRKCGVRL
jgi:hypothetical protein